MIRFKKLLSGTIAIVFLSTAISGGGVLASPLKDMKNEQKLLDQKKSELKTGIDRCAAAATPDELLDPRPTCPPVHEPYRADRWTGTNAHAALGLRAARRLPTIRSVCPDVANRKPAT